MVLANPLQYSGRLENSLHSKNPLSLLADSSQSANVTDRCTDGFAVVYTELARKQSLSNKYSIGGGICVWTLRKSDCVLIIFAAAGANGWASRKAPGL